MSSKRVNKFAMIFAGGVAVLVIGSAVASAGSDSKPSTSTATPAPKPNVAPTTEGDSNPLPKPVEKTDLQEFKMCVEEGGTVTEVEAVSHVVKLSGMDGWNGILDNPKVFTDYTGGLAAHGSDATLIATAFADCYKSNNGLVTVYDRDGHVAGNGQF